MKQLTEVLNNNYENCILPFLWLHGEETEEKIRQEVGHIYDSGIRAVCVEPRPHKYFLKDKWFEDLRVVLDECKNREMKMWLMSDSHYPTGYANGEAQRNHPELCKKFLFCKTLDFAGPVPESGAILEYALHSPEDRIISVTLSRKLGFELIDPETTIDVTENVEYVNSYNTGKKYGDMWGNEMPGVRPATPVVRFHLPEGEWSLNIITTSYKGGEKETEGYLNPIVPEATDLLLNTVYQPVYDRFGDEFGKTFLGFFYDEPRFGNIHGAEQSSIGRNSAMPLPWRDDMSAILTEWCRKIGGVLHGMDENELRRSLPLLFIGDGEKAHALRFAYMDLVSRMYSEHFEGRLVHWCHEHHCLQTGHCLEDDNAGARLGYGAGHIFRALANEDMAGIDVVMHQLLPGMDHGLFKSMHSPGWDGEYFTYILGKLGGSLANLDPKKHGRCVCELFGAYGWAEGNRLGKWMTDHLLVRGVNAFVPHAFNAVVFPDADCPPHFSVQGHNPQYPEFGLLMNYSRRMCSLLTGGVPKPCVALYYNAEGEWGGEYMLTQKPAAVLSRNQIDYNLISADFLERAEALDGKLTINGMVFKALVFPWAEALPWCLLSDVERLAAGGVNIYFIDDIPTRCIGDGDTGRLKTYPNINVVPLSGLSKRLCDDNVPELRTSEMQPYLRYYHYRQSDCDLYFFVNEHPGKRIQTVISGAKPGETYVYDAFENKVREETDAFTLDIPPYGSKVVLVPDEPIAEALPELEVFKENDRISLTGCSVSVAAADNMTEGNVGDFSEIAVLPAPMYVSSLQGYETFTGRIRYRFSVYLENEQTVVPARIVLDGVREGASVRVNGIYCGTKIVPDYHYQVLGLKPGENVIEVELNTTLGRTINDYLSQYLPMEPTGLSGARLELASQRNV